MRRIPKLPRVEVSPGAFDLKFYMHYLGVRSELGSGMQSLLYWVTVCLHLPQKIPVYTNCPAILVFLFALSEVPQFGHAPYG